MPGGEATPVDFGDVCINVDTAWFDEHQLAPPADLEALADPAYQDLLVVENPASSSPGLAFLLATIVKFGDDGWVDYWKRLRTNGVAGRRHVDRRLLRRLLRRRRRRPSRSSSATPAARPPRSCSPTRRSTRRRRPASTRRASARSSSPACCAAPSTPTRPASSSTSCCRRAFQSALPLNLFVYPANSTVALPDGVHRQRHRAGRPGDDGPGDDRRQPRDVARHVDRRGAALSVAAPSANRLPRPARRRPVAVPVAFLVIFYAWPFAELLARACARAPSPTPSVGRRRGGWRGSRCGRPLASTAATIVVGLAPAYVIARFAFVGPARAQRRCSPSVFVLPTVVMGAAVLALLPDGWERGVGPILLAHVIFNLAVVVRTVGAVWDHLPPDLEAAAATLGASPWRAFREVTLPLLRPAILAAASIVFVFTFTSFGVIRVLGDGRHGDAGGRGLASGDADRRHRRGRHAGRAAARRRRRRRRRGRRASSGVTAGPSPCARCARRRRARRPRRARRWSPRSSPSRR